jgi:hypothetical protein
MSGLERHNMQRDPEIDSWPHGSLMAINCGRFHPETGFQPNFSYQIYIGLLWFIHVYSIYRSNQGEYCRLARDHICIYLSHLIKYRGFRQIFLSFKSWRYSRSNGRGNPKFMSRPTCPHNVYGSYRIYGCKMVQATCRAYHPLYSRACHTTVTYITCRDQIWEWETHHLWKI